MLLKFEQFVSNSCSFIKGTIQSEVRSRLGLTTIVDLRINETLQTGAGETAPTPINRDRYRRTKVFIYF